MFHPPCFIVDLYGKKYHINYTILQPMAAIKLKNKDHPPVKFSSAGKGKEQSSKQGNQRI